MNVLILTPDRVGSTLLQRYLTVLMQGYDYGKPVINLHEMTNGLEFKYSLKFNQDILTKPEKFKWGYHQSLGEITRMLDSADHFKTSRLALYHIVNRKDSLSDQLSFYQYLNKNFYIISARRHNLFEHALSWCIVSASKHLNVYSPEEKTAVFKNIYEKGITVNPEVFTTYLGRYFNYLQWVNDHFNINSVFNYEDDLNNLDQYTSTLDIFPTNDKPKLWKDMFGISWEQWNACHYLNSAKHQSLSYNLTALENHGTKLIANDKKELFEIEKIHNGMLSVKSEQFLEQNQNAYVQSNRSISQMVQDDIMVTPISIKLQTLAEKALIVKNFAQLIDVFDSWCVKHNVQLSSSSINLAESAVAELTRLYNTIHDIR
jgi:hypothetical protein